MLASLISSFKVKAVGPCTAKSPNRSVNTLLQSKLWIDLTEKNTSLTSHFLQKLRAISREVLGCLGVQVFKIVFRSLSAVNQFVVALKVLFI